MPFTRGLAAGAVVTIDVVADTRRRARRQRSGDDHVRPRAATRRGNRHGDEEQIASAIAGLVAEEHLIAEGAAVATAGGVLSHRLDVRGDRVAIVAVGRETITLLRQILSQHASAAARGAQGSEQPPQSANCPLLIERRRSAPDWNERVSGLSLARLNQTEATLEIRRQFARALRPLGQVSRQRPQDNVDEFRQRGVHARGGGTVCEMLIRVVAASDPANGFLPVSIS